MKFSGIFALPVDTMYTNETVLCPKEALLNATVFNVTKVNPVNESLFDKLWDLHSTVPIILSVIMFGVLNFKSPTFFTKFNSLGKL